jgi:hypothetical protein
MGVAAGRRAGHLANIIIVHKIASLDSIWALNYSKMLIMLASLVILQTNNQGYLQ